GLEFGEGLRGIEVGDRRDERNLDVALGRHALGEIDGHEFSFGVVALVSAFLVNGSFASSRAGLRLVLCFSGRGLPARFVAGLSRTVTSSPRGRSAATVNSLPVALLLTRMN